MKKRLFLLLTLLLVLIAGMLSYGFFIGNQHITTKTTHITSDKLDRSFDGMSIVYFSDVHLNEFVTQERFETIVKKINKLNPDVILFGGDLLSEGFATTQDQETFLSSLQSLSAKYGKFAVFGEDDTNTPNLESLLTSANFELLSNQATKLYYDSDAFINLIGLTQPVATEQLMAIDTTVYTLAFGHFPTLIDEVNVTADLYLSGHTHGGQINLPLFNDPFIDDEIPQSETRVIVSNGVGTKKIDMRLFAPAQINQIILHSQQS